LSQFYLPRGGVYIYRLAGNLQGRPKMNASYSRIVHNVYYRFPCPQTFHKTVARRRDSAHVLLLCRNISYFGWSQNNKIHKVHFSRLSAKRPSDVLYSTNVLSPCSVSTSQQYCLLQSCVTPLVSAPQFAQHLLRSQMDFLFEEVVNVFIF